MATGKLVLEDTCVIGLVPGASFIVDGPDTVRLHRSAAPPREYRPCEAEPDIFGDYWRPENSRTWVFMGLNGRAVYAPALGRFLQHDRVAGTLADPLSLNRSAYARNNPTTYTDPSDPMFWLIA